MFIVVIIIEKFLLSGFGYRHIGKVNFNKILQLYTQQKDIDFSKYYEFRNIYFHSGKDSFDAKDWGCLKRILQRILSEYLTNKIAFNKKQMEFKEKILKEESD